MSLIAALIIIALVLFFFEIFIPGGILAVLGASLLLIASILTYAQYGWDPAVFVFVSSALLSIAFFFFEIKILPKLPIGRHLILGNPPAQRPSAGGNSPALPPEGAKQSGSGPLVGQTGEALTRMVPTGQVRVGTLAVEAISLSGMLPQGTPVQVVQQDAFRVLVKRVEEGRGSPSRP